MARDITKLHPLLQTKIVRLKELCSQQNLKIEISDTFRTVEEQNALYAQGRTKAGNIVTNVDGSSYGSMHQWGIAFDFYRNDGSGAYNDDGFFTKVGKLGQSIGLEWGGTWTSPVDKTHFQLPDWGTTAAVLKSKYQTPENFIRTWEKGSTVVITEKETGYMFEPKTVKSGSTGLSVLLLQEILKARGYKDQNGNDIVLDRIAGTATVYAINTYQTDRRKAGMEIGTNGKNDGICGAKMWKDLIAL